MLRKLWIVAICGMLLLASVTVSIETIYTHDDGVSNPTHVQLADGPHPPDDDDDANSNSASTGG